MGYVYTVLGSGRQGTAAAYDLALRGEASEIRLADADDAAVRRAVERLTSLIGAARLTGPAPKLTAAHADALRPETLDAAVQGSTAVLSALPFRCNLVAAHAALAARAHFCDLGGSTQMAREELALDHEAEAIGVSLVPDCGLAPGMAQTLAVFAMSKLERPRHVTIRCGGLPQRPRPPLGYQLLSNVAGLTHEYTGHAVVLRRGKREELPALSELETVEFPMPVGRCEAFLTSGGTSTAPWTFEGKLETYDYKTVRYPGHFDRIRCLIDLGFLGHEPLPVDGSAVVPRDVTQALFERALTFPGEPDLVVLRVECTESDPVEEGGGYRVNLLDFQDDETGFTATERTAAFPAAIVSHLQASGAIAPGARPVELAVPPDAFMSLLERRGFKIVHARL